MSSHGRRRPGSGQAPEPAGPSPVGPSPAGPSSVGPAQLGWALLVIAAALIGGLAAATLVHTSLTITVIVSVVAGGIAVLAGFRSPARPPEFKPGEAAEDDFGRYPAPRHPAPPAAQVAPIPAEPDGQARGVPPDGQARGAPPDGQARGGPPDGQARGAPPDGQVGGGPPDGNQTVVQLLPLPPRPGTAEPPGAPWWDSAQGGPPAPSPGAKRAPAPDLSTYLASTFIAQCPRCGAFRLDIRRARNGWDFHCEACEYTWTWQPGTPWPPVRVMPRGRKE